MALKLMYITNDPLVAVVAEKSGVDRIWIDLEYMGKEERQHGLNSVKSNHKISDIILLRPYIKNSDLMVRVNPLHDNSKEEIDAVINAGADLVMLPMFHTADDARRFVDLIGGRAKVMLLTETAEAIENLEEIVNVNGIDEIHIGLNDLYLAYRMKFMFELLVDGTVERACNIVREAGIPYGFGGIARLGKGALPAEYVIAEHYRLRSSMAILSRCFCNVNTDCIDNDIEELFITEMKKIREYEAYLQNQDDSFLNMNRLKVKDIVEMIIKGD
ncbi:MAG: aldolase/citrate lyase family protein [Oscillospiraceae bacterium]|nr:aldolase/citrate lyase family protein [Oscillospiraceae bacterium]